ncbi:unannotated protein [freshwater metagenome]|uniref:Unannotated protein n=1 Tax=freshwater metagenome TaxID=449393 RepID=A0A6J6UX91_9ZZZZ
MEAGESTDLLSGCALSVHYSVWFRSSLRTAAHWPRRQTGPSVCSSHVASHGGHDWYHRGRSQRDYCLRPQRPTSTCCFCDVHLAGPDRTLALQTRTLGHAHFRCWTPDNRRCRRSLRTGFCGEDQFQRAVKLCHFWRVRSGASFLGAVAWDHGRNLLDHLGTREGSQDCCLCSGSHPRRTGVTDLFSWRIICRGNCYGCVCVRPGPKPACT